MSDRNTNRRNSSAPRSGRSVDQRAGKLRLGLALRFVDRRRRHESRSFRLAPRGVETGGKALDAGKSLRPSQSGCYSSHDDIWRVTAQGVVS